MYTYTINWSLEIAIDVLMITYVLRTGLFFMIFVIQNIALQRIHFYRRFLPRFTQLSSQMSSYSTGTRMIQNATNRTVIVLAGATSAGKSAVSIELCKMLDAEIVVADSVQAYRCLDIGSNKPSHADTTTVPHHMINIADPSDVLSTGDYSRRASHVIFDILSRNRVPIVVGGSTMWIQWLCHGIPDAPKADVSVVKKAEELLYDAEIAKNWDSAMEILSQYDTERANKLARNDWYRMRRYLEIALSLSNIVSPNNSGKLGETDGSTDHKEVLTLTGEREYLLNGLDIRCFFLSEEREQLYHTIDSRCESMLRAGLFQEVSDLIRQDVLRPEYPVCKSIGYKQTLEYLCSPISESQEEKCIRFDNYFREFCTATRNYAKRQMNWYRKDPLFLFLRINRQSVEKNPYIDIANEIIHWTYRVSQEECFAAIEMQRGNAKEIAKCLGNRKQKRKYQSKDEMTSSIALFQTEAEKGIERSKEIEERKAKDIIYGIPFTQLQLSATAYDVRAPVGSSEGSSSYMRTYQTLITPTIESLRLQLRQKQKGNKFICDSSNDPVSMLRYVEEAEHFQRLIRESKPANFCESFLEQLKKANSSEFLTKDDDLNG